MTRGRRARARQRHLREAEWVKIPGSIGSDLFDRLEKGGAHKYVRRVRRGRRWVYYYDVTGGHGIGHHEEMHAGAKFRLKSRGHAGHYEVLEVNGDEVVIEHDESGHKVRMSKAALEKMLLREHAKLVDSHKARTRAEMAEVARFGSKRQKRAMREYVRRYGHTRPLQTNLHEQYGEQGAPKKGEKGHAELSPERRDALVQADAILDRARQVWEDPDQGWHVAYAAQVALGVAVTEDWLSEDSLGGEAELDPEDLPHLLGASHLSPQDAAEAIVLAVDVNERVPRPLMREMLADTIAPVGKMRLVNVPKAEALEFVQQHHSEMPEPNPRGLIYAIGIRDGERLVAVATASHPSGRWGSGRTDIRNIVELTRIASDGTGRKGASSKLAARVIDLLDKSKRGNPDEPGLFVTYSLLSEAGTTYKALREKGLRPVSLREGKEGGGGGARKGNKLGYAAPDKIRWEAGDAAGPADWSLLDLAVGGDKHAEAMAEQAKREAERLGKDRAAAKADLAAALATEGREGADATMAAAARVRATGGSPESLPGWERFATHSPWGPREPVVEAGRRYGTVRAAGVGAGHSWYVWDAKEKKVVDHAPGSAHAADAAEARASAAKWNDAAGRGATPHEEDAAEMGAKWRAKAVGLEDGQGPGQLGNWIRSMRDNVRMQPGVDISQHEHTRSRAALAALITERTRRKDQRSIARRAALAKKRERSRAAHNAARPQEDKTRKAAEYAERAAKVRQQPRAHDPGFSHSRYFASGSNRPGEIRGLADAGHNIGVAIDKLNEAAVVEIQGLKGEQVKVFVDSGAFSEVFVNFPGKSGKLPDPDRPVGIHTVAPISDEVWAERIEKMGRLTTLTWDRGEGQLYLVAPDKVGDQDETLRRLEKFADDVRGWEAASATVLVPVQKGSRRMADMWKRQMEILGPGDWVAAIPMKKDATSAEDLRVFLTSADPKPTRLHLLGLGLNSDAYPAVKAVLDEVGPEIEVSLDSNRKRAIVGHYQRKGEKGPPKKGTAALRDAEAKLKGRAFEDHADPDMATMWSEDRETRIGEYTTQKWRKAIAKEHSLPDRALFVSDPAAWMGKPADGGPVKGPDGLFREGPDGHPVETYAEQHPSIDAALRDQYEEWFTTGGGNTYYRQRRQNREMIKDEVDPRAHRDAKTRAREVRVAKAKAAAKPTRRLGVYGWSDATKADSAGLHLDQETGRVHHIDWAPKRMSADDVEEFNAAPRAKAAAMNRVLEAYDAGTREFGDGSGRYAVVIPDASEPGRWRYSEYDKSGFASHRTFDTPHEAAAAAADEGFTEAAPGTLDQLAVTDEWAEGTRAARVMQIANSAGGHGASAVLGHFARNGRSAAALAAIEAAVPELRAGRVPAALLPAAAEAISGRQPANEHRQRSFVDDDGKTHHVSPSDEQIGLMAQRAHGTLNPLVERWVVLNEKGSKTKVLDAYDALPPVEKAALAFQVEDLVGGDGYITAYRTLNRGDDPKQMGGASVSTNPKWKDKDNAHAFRVHHSDILLTHEQHESGAGANAVGSALGRSKGFGGYGSEQEVILKRTAQVEHLGLAKPPPAPALLPNDRNASTKPTSSAVQQSLGGEDWLAR
jgi:hypothetical protein